MKHTRLPISGIPFIADTSDELANYPESFAALRRALFDGESRETLDRIIRLRRDLDLEAMVVFADRQREQYFEPFIRMDAKSVFVDVGAFDGSTTRFAREKYGKGILCHAFEPLPSVREALKQSFADNADVFVHPVGLGDFDGDVAFQEAGTSSRVGTGESIITIRRLDSMGLKAVDFIKADIEGMEEAFLDGAAVTIIRSQPQLAIACYHSTAQLRRVFERGRRLLPDARVFLRHYTEGFAETDMFFVPPRFW